MEKKIEKKLHSRYDERELLLMKKHFKDNEPLLKLLRKAFLPEYDVDLPIGFNQVDMWSSMGLEQMMPHDREVAILARLKLINHLELHLAMLKTLADKEEETEGEQQERLRKDSMR